MRKIIKTIKSIEEFDLELFNELNIGLEIQDFTEPNLKEGQIREIVSGYRKVLKNFKGIKSLHGPFLDLKPASPDLQIRRVSYERYLKTLNIADELEIDYIIFHSQINPYLNEPYLSNLNNRQSRDFWFQILRETNFQGIILIENVFEEAPDMLKGYMETINMDNIRVNLDIGHAKLGKVPLEEWISQLKDYISYIHIHSNDGLYDRHLELTDKEIERLYLLLDKYKLNPILSLEYKIDNLTKEIKRYK